MNQCRIMICSADNSVKAITKWSEFAILVYNDEYKKGDYILVESNSERNYLTVCLEDSMPLSIVFMTEKFMRMDIPFDADKQAYSPKSFAGCLHMLSARFTDDDQIYQRRNLAHNPYDTTESENCYPHSIANAVTRGEAVFAARNTIDGIYANSSHGDYPYQSWGITIDSSAALKIDLGIPCIVDQIGLTLRADFPHDNYWVQASLAFSDGSQETIHFTKSALPQIFNINHRTTSWVILKDLIMSDEPSPFPALTQFEIWGQVKR